MCPRLFKGGEKMMIVKKDVFLKVASSALRLTPGRAVPPGILKHLTSSGMLSDLLASGVIEDDSADATETETPRKKGKAKPATVADIAETDLEEPEEG
jgi:hypothetical protein